MWYQQPATWISLASLLVAVLSLINSRIGTRTANKSYKLSLAQDERTALSIDVHLIDAWSITVTDDVRRVLLSVVFTNKAAAANSIVRAELSVLIRDADGLEDYTIIDMRLSPLPASAELPESSMVHLQTPLALGPREARGGWLSFDLTPNFLRGRSIEKLSLVAQDVLGAEVRLNGCFPSGGEGVSQKRKPKKIKKIATPKGTKLSQLRFNTSASELALIPIVGDGAIMQRNEAWGKFIPVLLVDCSARPDVRELFRIHRITEEMGDVAYSWRLSAREPYTAFLTLTFERPVKCSFSVEMPVDKYGGLIDVAVANELISIQSAKAGDRLSDKPDKDRIVVQVGSESFRVMWHDYYEKATVQRFLARGLSRSAAQESAAVAIREHRTLNDIRFPQT